jgi:hypothetical protein
MARMAAITAGRADRARDKVMSLRLGPSPEAVSARWRGCDSDGSLSAMGRAGRADARIRKSCLAWAAGAVLLVPTALACSSSANDPDRAAAKTAGAGGTGPAPGAGGASPAPTAAAAGTGGVGSELGADPPAASVAPLVPTCSGDTKLHATYHVPVAAELEPYATFDVSDLWFCQEDSAELSYDLPRMLVGGSERVELQGELDAAAPSLDLTGRLGTATCTAAAPDGTRVTCTEQLSGVTVDRAKVQSELADLPVDEAAARSAISDSFTQDPIGVLTFEVVAGRD